MKPFHLLCLLLPWVSFGQHVYFGERSDQDTSYSIYFDKDGFPYPNYPISDTSMERAYGSLFTWFQQHNEAFISICKDYEYFPESIDRKTILTLRSAIIRRWADTINARSESYPAIAFYIHGYRKAYHQSGSDVTSVTEFGMLRQELKTYGKPEAFEVNVYWDGMYDCCFSSNFKKNKQLFRLFTEAVHQAKKTGYCLRLLTNKLHNKPLQLITHSLGAQVAVSLLFNEPDVPANLPETPYQERISICMIAPAIGAKTLHAYRNRLPVSELDSTDNYRLMILYNEADFVLQKKDPKTGFFGPGVHRYGETGLGCNYHNEAVDLQHYFEMHFQGSIIRLVNCTALGQCHSLRCYTHDGNLREASNFLWENDAAAD